MFLFPTEFSRSCNVAKRDLVYEGGGGNQLIAGEETDIGFGAAFHDNRVEIEGVD